MGEMLGRISNPSASSPMASLKSSASRRHYLILSGAISALLASTQLHAANKTWDGGGADNNWLTPANWDADLVPAINDALSFAGSFRLGPFNNYSAGTLFNGIALVPARARSRLRAMASP
jgi:hypothetical protein